MEHNKITRQQKNRGKPFNPLGETNEETVDMPEIVSGFFLEMSKGDIFLFDLKYVGPIQVNILACT